MANKKPTKEELFRVAVLQHAEYLGMDPEKDKKYLHIAEEALKAPLPAGWEMAKSDDGTPYYFHEETGESSWDHPMDEFYRNKIKEERTKDEKTQQNSDAKKQESGLRSKNEDKQKNAAKDIAVIDDFDAEDSVDQFSKTSAFKMKEKESNKQSTFTSSAANKSKSKTDDEPDKDLEGAFKRTSSTSITSASSPDSKTNSRRKLFVFASGDSMDANKKGPSSPSASPLSRENSDTRKSTSARKSSSLKGLLAASSFDEEEEENFGSTPALNKKTASASSSSSTQKVEEEEKKKQIKKETFLSDDLQSVSSSSPSPTSLRRKSSPNKFRKDFLDEFAESDEEDDGGGRRASGKGKDAERPLSAASLSTKTGAAEKDSDKDKERPKSSFSASKDDDDDEFDFPSTTSNFSNTASSKPHQPKTSSSSSAATTVSKVTSTEATNRASFTTIKASSVSDNAFKGKELASEPPAGGKNTIKAVTVISGKKEQQTETKTEEKIVTNSSSSSAAAVATPALSTSAVPAKGSFGKDWKSWMLEDNTGSGDSQKPQEGGNSKTSSSSSERGESSPVVVSSTKLFTNGNDTSASPSTATSGAVTVPATTINSTFKSVGSRRPSAAAAESVMASASSISAATPAAGKLAGEKSREVEELKAPEQRKTQEIEQLQKEVQDLEKQNKQDQGEISELQQQLLQVKAKSEQAEKERTRLAAEDERHREELVAMRKELETLQHEAESLRRRLSDKENKVDLQSNSESDEVVLELKKQADKQKDDLRALERSKAELETSREKLSADYAQLKKEQEQSVEECKSLKAAHSQSQEEIKEIKEKSNLEKSSLEREKQELESKLSQLVDSLTKETESHRLLKEQTERLQSEFRAKESDATLSDVKFKLDRQSEEIKEWRAKEKEWGRDEDSYKQQIREKSQLIDDLEKKVSSLSDMVGRKDLRESEALSALQQQAQDALKERVKLETERIALKAQLNAKESEIDRLNRQIVEEVAKHRQLQNQLQSLSVQSETAEASVRTQRQKAEALEKEIVTLQDELAKAQIKRADESYISVSELEELKKAKFQLQRKATFQASELSQLREKLSAMEAEASVLTESSVARQEEVTRTRISLEAVTRRYEDAKRELSQRQNELQTERVSRQKKEMALEETVSALQAEIKTQSDLLMTKIRELERKAEDADYEGKRSLDKLKESESWRKREQQRVQERDTRISELEDELSAVRRRLANVEGGKLADDLKKEIAQLEQDLALAKLQAKAVEDEFKRYRYTSEEDLRRTQAEVQRQIADITAAAARKAEDEWRHKLDTLQTSLQTELQNQRRKLEEEMQNIEFQSRRIEETARQQLKEAGSEILLLRKELQHHEEMSRCLQDQIQALRFQASYIQMYGAFQAGPPQAFAHPGAAPSSPIARQMHSPVNQPAVGPYGEPIPVYMSPPAPPTQSGNESLPSSADKDPFNHVLMEKLRELENNVHQLKSACKATEELKDAPKEPERDLEGLKKALVYPEDQSVDEKEDINLLREKVGNSQEFNQFREKLRAESFSYPPIVEISAEQAEIDEQVRKLDSISLRNAVDRLANQVSALAGDNAGEGHKSLWVRPARLTEAATASRMDVWKARYGLSSTLH